MPLTVTPAVTEIVMIEDEPGISDFVKRGLDARGFQVDCAFDGDSGLECALGDRVALVLLDLMLPGRPGLEVLSELVERRPGLPVIVLTARGQLEDRVEGLNAGAADYLVKPFMLAELEARIRAQLRSARQAEAIFSQSGEIYLGQREHPVSDRAAAGSRRAAAGWGGRGHELRRSPRAAAGPRPRVLRADATRRRIMLRRHQHGMLSRVTLACVLRLPRRDHGARGHDHLRR